MGSSRTLSTRISNKRDFFWIARSIVKTSLPNQAQSLMTSTCGVAETYVSEITKLSVDFLKGAKKWKQR